MKPVYDTFGVPIQVGDRVLKTRVSKFGGKRLWLYVVGFTETVDGHPIMHVRRIKGFNRPGKHCRTIGAKSAAKQGLNSSHTTLGLPPTSHFMQAQHKIRYGDNCPITISRRVSQHTSHHGYYIDHKWRETYAKLTKGKNDA